MSELASAIAPIVIGLMVGTDNFRAGIGLGVQKMSLLGRKQITVYFILFEAITPVLGLVIGSSVSEAIGHWSIYVGPAVLASLGIFVVCDAFRCSKTVERKALDSYWVILGLPVSLSFDNLFAGVGLGLLGFPVLLSAMIVGATSALMSIAGLRFGIIIRKYLPYRTELFSGAFLIIIALASLVHIQ